MNLSTQRITLAIGLLALSGLLLAACGPVSLLPAQNEPTALPTVLSSHAVSVEGRLAPARSSLLAFQTGGEIAALPVAEGQAVRQGDILASLAQREPAEAALATARLEQLSAQQALDELNNHAELAKAQAAQELAEANRAAIDAQQALDDLDRDAFQDKLENQISAVQDAKDARDDAQDELDGYRDLAADNPTRERAQDKLDDARRAYDDAQRERDRLENQRDQARAARDLALARLDDAQQAYNDLLDGPDPDQLALATARLENADAQIAAASLALRNMDLTAPYDGVVVDLNDLEAGESVAPGKPVVSLADFSAWYVETRDLTELEVVDVEVGQAVRVVPDALPDLELTGTVESIDQAYTERSGDILYSVRVRLDQADARLRWGMTVTAEFAE